MGSNKNKKRVNMNNITPNQKPAETKVEDIVEETVIDENVEHVDTEVRESESHITETSTNMTAEVDETKVEKVELDAPKQNSFNKEDLQKQVKSTKQELEKRALQITNAANSLDEEFNNLETDEEKEIYLQTVAEQLGITSNELSELVATDLPASEIIEGIPVRIIEQLIRSTTANYPLAKYQRIVFRQNGIVDIDYKDYTDNDSISGFADVSIDDYNKGINPLFRETYQVDTETSKGYDMLDTLLNDIRMTLGGFVALLMDFKNNVVKPMSKFMYKRHLEFLDTTTVDKEITFTSNDVKEKAKTVLIELLEMQSASRNNLVVKPTGASVALEYAAAVKDTVIVMDINYAADYKYDLSAGTFQLGEIQLPVADIIITSFSKFKEYATITTNLDGCELFAFDKNFYEEFIHYTGIKVTDTPKLKSVINTYSRHGNFRYKDAMFMVFKSFTPVE